ncbi:hypothetical protein BKH43_01625 [Helicobacter sp. 13S00401-1]|uniref:methyltransferase domain-containing protein n=1 Tax=Helicobacter sp. 13S00401-1 TaxID=1905758 RepID=UPI000BA6CDA9|nr:methyltransferase domain-containing protein [Helicobacter sp. 13S00401-1]PAF51366.1 hypothetical protein BKH43_01625 [Helicobacter sp. 13S00401-1]
MTTQWNPDLYLRFQSERTKPALDLANMINIKHALRILDVGCGPGNSTSVLRKKYENAYIVGIDNSIAMIEKAKNTYSDIDFLCMNVENAKELCSNGGKFDIVFSNACLQWVNDHKNLLPFLMSLLKSDGILAVQIPDKPKAIINTILTEISNMPKWNESFKDIRSYHALSVNEYFDVLATCTKDFEIKETIYMHRLPDIDSIITWYKATGLKPYLERLEGDLQAEFLEDVLKELRLHFKPQCNGEILLPFPRIFLLGKAF